MKPDPFYGTAFLLVAVGLAYRASEGGPMWVLAWPSLSFLLVSLAYLLGMVQVFGKQGDGRRARSRAIMLWPYTFLAWIVWQCQIRISHAPAWQAVDDSLIVSRRLRSGEMPENVKVVVDLTSEMRDPPSIRAMPGYLCIPILDANALTPECLAEHVRHLPGPEAGRILIHCANGHGRTGLVAAAWMIHHGLAATPAEAIDLLMSKRPGIRLRPCQHKSLEGACPILLAPDERCAA